jgi:hypothetical protein
MKMEFNLIYKWINFNFLYKIDQNKIQKVGHTIKLKVPLNNKRAKLKFLKKIMNQTLVWTLYSYLYTNVMLFSHLVLGPLMVKILTSVGWL